MRGQLETVGQDVAALLQAALLQAADDKAAALESQIAELRAAHHEQEARAAAHKAEADTLRGKLAVLEPTCEARGDALEAVADMLDCAMTGDAVPKAVAELLRTAEESRREVASMRSVLTQVEAALTRAREPLEAAAQAVRVGLAGSTAQPFGVAEQSQPAPVSALLVQEIACTMAVNRSTDGYLTEATAVLEHLRKTGRLK